MRVKIHNTKLTFTRALRKSSTDAERLLWYKLRGRQIARIKFRRQQIIGKFIVDFVSFEKKLIIELDGGQHNDSENRCKDEQRTQFLENEGYRVIRVWNNEIFHNMDEILNKIYSIISPHPDPLPQGEREEF